MGRYDGDIDILAEVVEEAEKALERKVFEGSRKEAGRFWVG